MSEAAQEEVQEEGVSFEEGDGGSLAVDLSSVAEDVGFETIPRGTYDVVIDEVDYAVSQSGGNPMWSLTLVVENHDDFTGRKLFTHVVFSDKMMGRAKQTLNMLGLTNLTEGPFNPEDADAYEQLIGRQARAVVSIRKYEGEDRNQVKSLKPRPAGDGFDD